MAKELHFTSKDMPISEFDRKELKGRIETNPEYQRDFVYSVEKSSRIILTKTLINWQRNHCY